MSAESSRQSPLRQRLTLLSDFFLSWLKERGRYKFSVRFVSQDNKGERDVSETMFMRIASHR